MADWSQLPTELLILISNRLNSDLYLLRFRSVCSTWRNSILNNHHHQHRQNLPSKLPLLSNSINDPNSTNKSTTVSLSKRTLFLIFPPPQIQTLHPHHHPWLIKIKINNNNNNLLLNPLSRHSPLLPYFPHLLDFNDLTVVELGHEFVLDDAAEFPSLPPPAVSFNNLFLEKVVVFEIEHCFVLLTIHVSGKLAVFRCGDERWTIIPEMPMPYDDVCVFKGKPIAVDGTGRTFRVKVGVEMELGLDLVADPVFGGDKKYLVESNGELLLVDKHLSCVCYCSVCDEDDDGDGGMVGGESGDDYGIGWERVVKFDVYKLDEKEKRWVELTSLRDRILFLGDDCAFSLSASDLGFRNGNCVIFRDDAFNKFRFETGVFDLELQKISPLHKDYNLYFDLFWPPEWIRLG